MLGPHPSRAVFDADGFLDDARSPSSDPAYASSLRGCQQQAGEARAEAEGTSYDALLLRDGETSSRRGIAAIGLWPLEVDEQQPSSSPALQFPSERWSARSAALSRPSTPNSDDGESFVSVEEFPRVGEEQHDDTADAGGHLNASSSTPAFDHVELLAAVVGLPPLAIGPGQRPPSVSTFGRPSRSREQVIATPERRHQPRDSMGSIGTFGGNLSVSHVNGSRSSPVLDDDDSNDNGLNDDDEADSYEKGGRVGSEDRARLSPVSHTASGLPSSFGIDARMHPPHRYIDPPQTAGHSSSSSIPASRRSSVHTFPISLSSSDSGYIIDPPAEASEALTGPSMLDLSCDSDETSDEGTENGIGDQPQGTGDEEADLQFRQWTAWRAFKLDRVLGAGANRSAFDPNTFAQVLTSPQPTDHPDSQMASSSAGMGSRHVKRPSFDSFLSLCGSDDDAASIRSTAPFLPASTDQTPAPQRVYKSSAMVSPTVCTSDSIPIKALDRTEKAILIRRSRKLEHILGQTLQEDVVAGRLLAGARLTRWSSDPESGPYSQSTDWQPQRLASDPPGGDDAQRKSGFRTVARKPSFQQRLGIRRSRKGSLESDGRWGGASVYCGPGPCAPESSSQSPHPRSLPNSPTGMLDFLPLSPTECSSSSAPSSQSIHHILPRHHHHPSVFHLFASSSTLSLPLSISSLSLALDSIENSPPLRSSSGTDCPSLASTSPETEDKMRRVRMARLSKMRHVLGENVPQEHVLPEPGFPKHHDLNSYNSTPPGESGSKGWKSKVERVKERARAAEGIKVLSARRPVSDGSKAFPKAWDAALGLSRNEAGSVPSFLSLAPDDGPMDDTTMGTEGPASKRGVKLSALFGERPPPNLYHTRSVSSPPSSGLRRKVSAVHSSEDNPSGAARIQEHVGGVGLIAGMGGMRSVLEFD